MKRFAFIAAIFVLGCTEKDTPTWDTNACNEFIVPHEFGLGWTTLNHRLSEWKVRPSHAGCLADDIFVRHVGGDFSTGDAFGQTDEPTLAFGYQRVETDRDEVGIARVSLSGIVTRTGRWTATRTYKRSALNLRHYGQVTAIIEGMTFDTGIAQESGYPRGYNPAHGYTVRGFGASAKVLDVTATEIVLEVSTRFEPALAADRPNHNDAIEVAEVETSLDVLLVATTDDVPVERAEHGLEVEYRKPKPLEDLEIPGPSIDAQRVVVEGDLSEGFRGISSFDYTFDFKAECEQNSDCFLTGECMESGTCRLDRPVGDYLREIRVALNVEEESNALLFNGYASNSSSFLTFFGLNYRFVGEAIWVGADVKKSENRIAQRFETGSIVVPLP